MNKTASAIAILFLVAAATRAAAQVAVMGVVHDSLSRKPLAGALVQLVDADDKQRGPRSATSDDHGRFAFNDVPDGQYTLGFFHPTVDSLGLPFIAQDIRVTGRTPVHADLAIPSAATLRAAFCGAADATDQVSGVVLGVVRDAESEAPIDSAVILTRWREFAVQGKTVQQRTRGNGAISNKDGWFVLCEGGPSTTASLVIERDSGNVVQSFVLMPADGLLRRDFYVGHAGVAARLSGTVATAGRPLAGAQVSVPQGGETTTNAKGEWTLPAVPLGTRMLDVHAVGRDPYHEPIDVLPEARPIAISLAPAAISLDAVQVTAERTVASNATFHGFDTRKKNSLFGLFVTAGDIARQSPGYTSMMIVIGSRGIVDAGADRFTFSAPGRAGRCDAAIFINGIFHGTMSPSELDDLAPIDRVDGIEIYRGSLFGGSSFGTSQIPPEFDPNIRGGADGTMCGSIVIWIKYATPKTDR